jgi:hypothetical protein
MSKREEKADDIERIVVSCSNSTENAKVEQNLVKVANLIATNYDAFLKTTKPFSL